MTIQSLYKNLTAMFSGRKALLYCLVLTGLLITVLSCRCDLEEDHKNDKDTNNTSEKKRMDKDSTFVKKL
jgi:hypothetical protein